MAFYSFMQFYTDTFDTYRVTKVIVNGITKQDRTPILSGIPCRVYQNNTNAPSLSETAATVGWSNTLMCELGYDIIAGDEVIVHRGANVGRHVNPDERYIAGPPNIYVEPFGGCSPDLEHMQIALTDEQAIQ